jgi:hypothetical protein
MDYFHNILPLYGCAFLPYITCGLVAVILIFRNKRRLIPSGLIASLSGSMVIHGSSKAVASCLGNEAWWLELMSLAKVPLNPNKGAPGQSFPILDYAFTA